MLMTWSLGIEVQFYLLLPLIAVGLYRRTKRVFLGLMTLFLLLSFSYATFAMHRGWSGAFFLLSGRWWELAVGVLLGTVQADKGSSFAIRTSAISEICGLLGLLGVLVSIDLPEPTALLLFPPVVVPVAAAVLLCMSAKSWVNRSLLSLKAFSGIGRRSYSLYLWHWPLLSLGYVCGAGYLALRGRLVMLALTFVLAEVCYRYIERPFRRPRSKAQAGTALAAMGSVVILLSSALVFTHGFPQRRPAATVIETAVRGDALARMCLMPDIANVAKIPPACRSPEPSVALIGDSHAAALSQAVKDLNPDLELIMKSSCPPLLGVTIRDSGPDRCSTFEGDAVKRIVAEPSVSTVVVAGYWLNPSYDVTHQMRYVTAIRYYAATSEEDSWTNLRDGLLALCLSLQNAHKKVVLVEDVPISMYDPHLLAVGNTIPSRALLGRWLALAPSWNEREAHPITAEERRMHSLLLDVATQSKSELVSLYEPLCDGFTCKVIDKGMPLFEDRQHLSGLGAKNLLLADRWTTVLAPKGASGSGGQLEDTR
ncbi:acyltransferase family protein [Granulicella paludicola]|uniref:acyltransferase family protein n=1 Tax=Granulicella paludicola TaxID=474951 RepID=UPI0037C17D7A